MRATANLVIFVGDEQGKEAQWRTHLLMQADLKSIGLGSDFPYYLLQSCRDYFVAYHALKKLTGLLLQSMLPQEPSLDMSVGRYWEKHQIPDIVKDGEILSTYLADRIQPEFVKNMATYWYDLFFFLKQEKKGYDLRDVNSREVVFSSDDCQFLYKDTRLPCQVIDLDSVTISAMEISREQCHCLYVSRHNDYITVNANNFSFRI